MNFTNHLFISYAHIDNEQTEENDPGWVDRFHKSLKAFLSSSIGEEAVIWRDLKLEGGDVFGEEIVNQFPKTALLVSILSPRYLKSEWCLKEIEEFCKAAESHGGLVIGNKLRVHRVMLVPLAVDVREKLPGKLNQELGYPFYKENEGGRFQRLDPRFGDEFKAAFNLKVASMADELAEIIKKLKEEENPIPESASAKPAGPPKPVIYLAECSWDRGDDREKIRSELRATGYMVLPDQGTRLPEMEVEYVAEVGALLDRCQISIHVVGANGGVVLNGPGRKDSVQLQNEIAAQKSEDRGLSRLIWLPTVSSGQPEQQSFIDALRSQKELQFGGDLIEDNLEGFKNILRVTLKKLEEPAPKEAVTAAVGGHTIYLLCVAADRPATIPLRKFLKGQVLEVQLPVFEGDAATVRQAHQELLATCDAVLIFYGAGDEAWKRTTETDLQKIKSSRPGKPLLNIFTYLAAPMTGHKQDCIDMGEENLIVGLETFSEAAMQPLVEAMKDA
ncbi:MAG: toll/interleukin-1 receptor domain-containing protein [Candidatus Udaeobacter sp.]